MTEQFSFDAFEKERARLVRERDKLRERARAIDARLRKIAQAEAIARDLVGAPSQEQPAAPRGPWKYTPEQDAAILAKEASDAELAARFGRTARAIRDHRSELNIKLRKAGSATLADGFGAAMGEASKNLVSSLTDEFDAAVDEAVGVEPPKTADILDLDLPLIGEAASSNGKTSDFDSDNPGSTPGAAAKKPKAVGKRWTAPAVRDARQEELDAMARFEAERGVTKCPDSLSPEIAQVPLMQKNFRTGKYYRE